MLEAKASVDSDETEFLKSTHAWCVSKEIDTNKPEKEIDRIIGAIIIGFQMFTYYLFAAEAIEDYQKGGACADIETIDLQLIVHKLSDARPSLALPLSPSALQ